MSYMLDDVSMLETDFTEDQPNRVNIQQDNSLWYTDC